MSILMLVMLGLFAALMVTQIALVFWAPESSKARDFIRDVSFFASQVLAAILVLVAMTKA